MNLLLVDDHALIRQGLRIAFQEAGGFAVLSEAATGAGALAALASRRCDAVIMDINLPDINGLDVIRTMRDRGDRTPVLVLSMHSEESLGYRAIRAGADGYLSKDAAPEEIAHALKQIVAGRKYFSVDVMYSFVNGDGRSGKKLHDQLSDREYQVMFGLARGQSVTQIADTLRISPNTVSTYRTRVLEKLGVDSNAALTRYALIHKLID